MCIYLCSTMEDHSWYLFDLLYKDNQHDTVHSPKVFIYTESRLYLLLEGLEYDSVVEGLIPVAACLLTSLHL